MVLFCENDSLKDHRLYKGTCEDFPKRFIRHNSGGNKSTAHRKPFVLIHIEIFQEKNLHWPKNDF